jgi:hypothetical protein
MKPYQWLLNIERQDIRPATKWWKSAFISAIEAATSNVLMVILFEAFVFYYFGLQIELRI